MLKFSGHAERIVEALGQTSAIIEFDVNGFILNANETFLQGMGYTLEEIRGKHHSIFVGVGERDTPAYGKFWDDLRAGRLERVMPGWSPPPVGLNLLMPPGAARPARVTALVAFLERRLATAPWAADPWTTRPRTDGSFNNPGDRMADP